MEQLAEFTVFASGLGRGQIVVETLGHDGFDSGKQAKNTRHCAPIASCLTTGGVRAEKRNTPAACHGRRGARAPGQAAGTARPGEARAAAALTGRRPQDQCALAADAPIPVSLRTVWASKPARSIRARSLRSVTENSQIDTKPIVMENSAGEA